MSKHLEIMHLETKLQPFQLKNDRDIGVQLDVPSPTFRSSNTVVVYTGQVSFLVSLIHIAMPRIKVLNQ